MLDSWAERLFERIYPGLLQKVQDLGEGAFLPDLPWKEVSRDRVLRFRIAFSYGLADGMLVRVNCSFQPKDGTGPLERYHYSHACCASHYDRKNRYFGVDYHASEGYHVHMPPEVKRQISVSQIDIGDQLRDIRPEKFVQLVEEFRRNVSSGMDPYSREAIPFQKVRP